MKNINQEKELNTLRLNDVKNASKTKEQKAIDIEKLFNNKFFKKNMESNISHILVSQDKNCSFVLTTKESESYTDGKRIVVGLPAECLDMNNEKIFGIIKGLVGHETAHVRWSNFTGLRNFVAEVQKKGYNLNIAKALSNIIEDGRIERLLCEEFNGYSKYIKFKNLALIYGEDGNLKDNGLLVNIINSTLYLSKLGIYPNNANDLFSEEELDVLDSQIKPKVLKGVNSNSYKTVFDVTFEILDILYKLFPKQDNVDMSSLQQYVEETYKTSNGEDDKSNDNKSVKMPNKPSKNSSNTSSKSSSKSKEKDKSNNEKEDDANESKGKGSKKSDNLDDNNEENIGSGEENSDKENSNENNTGESGNSDNSNEQDGEESNGKGSSDEGEESDKEGNGSSNNGELDNDDSNSDKENANNENNQDNLTDGENNNSNKSEDASSQDDNNSNENGEDNDNGEPDDKSDSSSQDDKDNNRPNENSDDILPNHLPSTDYNPEDNSYELTEEDKIENLKELLDEEVTRAFEVENKSNQLKEKLEKERLNQFHENIDVSAINKSYKSNLQEPNFQYLYPDINYMNPPKEFALKIRILQNQFAKFLQNEDSEYKNQVKGRLNTSNLWKLSLNKKDIFSKKNCQDETDYSVYILIDLSGSMCDMVKYRNAIGTAICIESALTGLDGVYVKTVGFNYSSGSKLQVFKEFKDKKSKTPVAYSRDFTGGSNRDGFAIRVALEDLKKQPTKNKLLVVISDGMPAWSYESTEDAMTDVRNAVHEGRKHSTIMSILINNGPIGERTKEAFHYMYESKGSIMADVRNEPDKLMNNIVLYLRHMFKN